MGFQTFFGLPWMLLCLVSFLHWYLSLSMATLHSLTLFRSWRLLKLSWVWALDDYLWSSSIKIPKIASSSCQLELWCKGGMSSFCYVALKETFSDWSDLQKGAWTKFPPAPEGLLLPEPVLQTPNGDALELVLSSTGTDDWEIDSSQLKFVQKVANGSFGDLWVNLSYYPIKGENVNQVIVWIIWVIT